MTKKITTIFTLITLCFFSQFSLAALDRQVVEEVVLKSPYLVGQQDKSAWLNLFSDFAQVNDPVGAPTNASEGTGDNQALDNFWDVFINDNTIIFHPQKEDFIVAGNEVVRDVIIQTDLGDGIVVNTPTYILYEVVEEQGAAKISQLNAHWQVIDQASQILAYSNGLLKTFSQFGKMVAEQGLINAIRYSQALAIGTFDAGKTKVKKIETAIQNKNGEALSDLLNDRFFLYPNANVDFPVASQHHVDVSTFVNRIIATDSFKLDELRSAGWYTSGRFSFVENSQTVSGIVFFEFWPWTNYIKDVRFFWNT